jgi:hypothetical protein
MTENEELEIAFYKGGAVHDVLKRFVFNDEEKKIITAAILTSKKEIPNMNFIHKANALLEEVAQTRKPVEISTKTELNPEIIATFEMMEAQQKERDLKKENSLIKKLLYSNKTVVYIIAVLFIFMIFSSLYNK